MGSRIRCFWLEPTDRVRVYLRRYASKEEGAPPCTEMAGENGYHQAMVFIEERPVLWGRGGEGNRRYMQEQKHPLDDTRWPKACGCGYAFHPRVPFQVFQRQIYRRQDTAELLELEQAPAGAMWDAWWIAEGRLYTGPGSMIGPDGRSLMVRTPGAEWCVDQPAKNGPGWTRTGAVPDVTATPSIVAGDYHGHLRNGWLEEC